jgi:hypothetical protein
MITKVKLRELLVASETKTAEIEDMGSISATNGRVKLATRSPE